MGWNEFEIDGNGEAVIFVLDAVFGYNVYRGGAKLRLIGWYNELWQAVEAGVDYSRKEIADHEIKQQKKEII